MKRNIFHTILVFFVFLVGVVVGMLIYRNHILITLNGNRNGLPDSIGVCIDSTNLPIIFINTLGQKVDRKDPITARMKIIYNQSSFNYGDTIIYPKQQEDYDGYISFKYRGHTSFYDSDKKSYAIRALDKPLSEGGKKKKSKLLGMRKGKKWALVAPHIDKSMIRNALTYELARPYMDFVPETRFCEVIIDGIYYGVYVLTEQVTADRLYLSKPTDKGDGITGGYLLQIDSRRTNGAFMSKHWNYGYCYEYPDSNKLTQNQRQYINNTIIQTEDALMSQQWEMIEPLIDIESMISYQLMTEFSHNADGYTLSTFIYKFSSNDDGRFKFSLWDYDLAYGNYAVKGCSNTDTWIIKSWWKEMMKHPTYTDRLKQKWVAYRQDNLSDQHVFNTIDSLTLILQSGGAEKRNSEAWTSLWSSDWTGPKRNGAQKFLSASYEEEIEYLKEWISKRLKWMDENL